MERGDLVPDEVTIAMVRDRLADDDAGAGSCSTGSPATCRRPRRSRRCSWPGTPGWTWCWNWWWTTTRWCAGCSGRRTCRRCGQVWHATFDPPARHGICDDCGGELFQRDDDREQTIRHRLEVYQQQTAPLVSFYADEGILLGLDATGPVDEITERALSALRRFIR